MARPVKRDLATPKRAYHSPRREQQAAATRQAILDAARQLFITDGYARTTMEAIATEADVALKTVYLGFETKSRLLRAIWDLALKGDTADAPVAERDWYKEVLDAPDPVTRLRRNARNSRVVKERIGAVLGAIRDGAATDADVDGLWQLIQADFRANQGVIVASLADEDALAPGLGVERATDILWTLNHPDVWRLLVSARGWTPDEYEAWFADTSCAQLLRRPPRRRRTSSD